MIFDFSFILVVATALTGVIWGLDSWLFKPKRVRSRAAQAASRPRTCASRSWSSTRARSSRSS